MKNLIKIAFRNLFRNKRRTILTSSLITFGVVLVIVFGGLAISFKSQMVGILTNTAMGDLQIHHNGYVESIDNLPLNLTLSGTELEKVEKILSDIPEVASYSPRIKIGAMISNYAQTSNIRMSAVYPKMENRTVPEFAKRIKGNIPNPDEFLKQGEILVPENLMKGLSLKIGDEIVLVATNKDGSVNAITLRIAAMTENVFGPSGKDGYMHIEDAQFLLRQDQPEIVEIAIHLQRYDQLNKVYSQLKQSSISKDSKFEVHTWEQLSPFASIARIVDLLIIVVKFILISIVLVSILNIMTMSVYERISEIGTIAAIGTSPRRILSLFLIEGSAMGLLSTVAGIIIGLGILWIMNISKIDFTFGSMDLSLAPSIPASEVLVVAVIVMIVSLFAGLQPAYKASKMEPVDALGHN
ncbi:MAG: ABC transporter substrate-binding protein [Ignavibacteria bacterium RIFOXYB2_FULL_35_12]|nr:MAG: ABC transporter substrate-binding protein [Ignavibacteria bacterium GWA2_36_19]OGU53041.1 MAG: ABC transporter substrate-binding protein [Ignavibacteria bacterium GWC2_35_8]OGU62185.1 MAG: ABC transporter substrate-binding protein [Ignavibacteria bacterium GWF2_35_20]OGU84591.1 MAG: ABC transporter substrate-binding protein [Ignavibacteria bacterium RIFOXYA12_FULL_35_25]OGU96861.1 MAG: ABC transporter substrate-binding protein [Ignavibacteria bacterium RIFOXYB12_FULL_35_14]OGV01301.1 M